MAFRREPPPRSRYGERRLANHERNNLTSHLRGRPTVLMGPVTIQIDCEDRERPTRPHVAEPSYPRSSSKRARLLGPHLRVHVEPGL